MALVLRMLMISVEGDVADDADDDAGHGVDKVW